MGGIGTAICRQLCRAGVRVVAGCRPGSPRREAWLEAMQREDCKVEASEGDVSDWKSMRDAMTAVRERFGPVDILVNNAGITRDVTFRRLTEQDWHDVMGTNLHGAFNATRHVIDDMVDRGWGRIINVSSVNAQRGQYGQTNYSTAKAGLYGFTRALALEVASRGVTVNAISPGYVETEMITSMRPDVLDRVIASIPARRLGTPEEVASMVCWLASDEAAYATGANFSLNGGLHMA
jgi:acetoacetyl-CoA reductase